MLIIVSAALYRLDGSLRRTFIFLATIQATLQSNVFFTENHGAKSTENHGGVDAQEKLVFCKKNSINTTLPLFTLWFSVLFSPWFSVKKQTTYSEHPLLLTILLSGLLLIYSCNFEVFKKGPVEKAPLAGHILEYGTNAPIPNALVYIQESESESLGNISCQQMDTVFSDVTVIINSR